LYYGSDHLPVYCDFIFTNTTSIEEGEPISSFELYQNYPNPFNPVTTISFYLDKSADVKLIVYNSIGQKVKVLLDQKMNSGLHNIPFEVNNLGTGLYYYKLSTYEGFLTRKMLYLK
jgi:type IX secretion system substrate protein